MKFAGFPKFLLPAVLAGAAALGGCGFLNSSHSGSGLNSGNWSFIATSTIVSGQISHIGGNLTLSGTNVSSTMHSDLPCFDISAPFAFGGTLQNHQITFTSAANTNNQVITLIATVTSPTTITGTYTVNAGGGCAADQGSITASLVPSISGTWAGPIAGSGGPAVSLSMALTQASSASSDGTFALTGNVTFTNSSCSKNGTINNSSLAGSMLIINANTLEQDGVTQGSFSYTDALLNNPATPATMSGTYQVVTGYCAGDADTPTFAKQ